MTKSPRNDSLEKNVEPKLKILSIIMFYGLVIFGFSFYKLKKHGAEDSPLGHRYRF